MEEEIDLREYIKVITRRWYWIVGLTLVAAVVAFVVSSVLPPTYEATAMVVVTQPRYRLQFDSRVQNIPFDPTQLAKGYPVIATSDDLLLSVAQELNSTLTSENHSPGRLRKVLTAQTAGDPTLIKLTAQSQDPQKAATLVNVWAKQYVEYLNDIYGGNNALSLFEAQVAEARAALEEADQVLATFRGEYGLGLSHGNISVENYSEEISLELGIAGRLQAKTALLTQYEIQGDRTTQLLGEARMAVAQADDTVSPTVLAGLLADLLRFGLVDSQTVSPVQISLEGLDAESGLSALITALEVKQNSTNETIALLTTEVEILQAELADRQRELDQMLRDQKMLEDTYLTLSAKVQEARIEAQDETGDTARLLSHAAVPNRPVSPRRRLNTMMAGTLGFVLGVFGVLFIDYWREGTWESPADRDQSAG